MATSNRRDHPETSPEGRQAKSDAERTDTVAAGVQEIVDQETKQGFRGVEVDPTPNENYTVAGVTSGAPTPETDAATLKAAREGQTDAEKKATGVGER